MLGVWNPLESLPTGQDILTEVLRDGASRMLAQAIEAEISRSGDIIRN
jgi:putative transposase